MRQKLTAVVTKMVTSSAATKTVFFVKKVVTYFATKVTSSAATKTVFLCEKSGDVFCDKSGRFLRQKW